MFRKRRRYSYYNSYSSRGYSRRTSRSYGRKQRIRWDRVALISGIVIIILGIVVWLNLSRMKLMFKGYSFNQQNVILKLEKEDIHHIISYDKLDHISQWIENSQNVKYYDEYEKYYSLHEDFDIQVIIQSIDDYFDEYIPKMQTLNYNEDQIWEVLKTADKEDLQYLINHNYSYSQIQPYMQVKGFNFTDLEQYMTLYASNHNYNYAVLATTYPFIISTNKPKTTYMIQNVDDVNILIKPGFMLPSTYVPSDLKKPDEIPVAPDCNHYQMRQVAADALTKMYNDAKKEGYYLVINSAYRSYSEQQKTYDDYFKKYDEVTASGLVAKPGTSEHQSGLGVDLTSQSVLDGERLVFGDTIEYKWCKENSYKYGFILRFAEDESNITGIAHEPWHFRYVGIDVATECYNNDWTLEEYCLNKGVIPTIKQN